jgi:flagellar motility protein MotE (MotC chaperone)
MSGAHMMRRMPHETRHQQGASMFAKLAFALLLIATPAFAQDAVPDTLALSDEDAQTCKAKSCRTITDAAYELIAQRLQRAEEIEAIAQRLARELAKKPNPKFCL